MLQVKEMIPEDRTAVLPMVHGFYHSDAVEHAVDERIVEQTFADAVSEKPDLRGVTLWSENEMIGFAYLTTFYACEVCGITVMIEELYLREEYRGKGYGTEFFNWLFREYSHAARFRMEVTDDNEKAIRLYKKLGFSFMNYSQMIRDK